MRECNIDKNKKGCNCSYGSCVREGICCECIAYHKKNYQFPACFFPDDVEKTYDRSIDTFIKTYQERGPWW